MPDPHQEIADLEAEIDALVDAAERCRKIIVLAKAAIATGDPMGAIGSILLSGRVRVLNHPRGSDHASPLSSTSRTPCYPH